MVVARVPSARPGSTDLVCFSHLRWDHVFQRPNHLLTRAARDRRVFYWEEPRVGGEARVDVTEVAPSLFRVVPHIPLDTPKDGGAPILRGLLDGILHRSAVTSPVLWFYSPMALRFARHVAASAVVYDCMDDLTSFRGAAPMLLDLERELLTRADVLFTGGASLHEAKAESHPNAHCFPSSIDAPHFAAAREPGPEPADHARIARPRIGYMGVVDERVDLDLVTAVADARPEWQVVMLGPVVKVDDDALPQRANLHWLGPRDYADLPRYLRGWDVAIMPFARNAATRFISPTKTPEYLAAGLPVVSTGIRDVVRPYGERGLVRIADDAAAFTTAIEAALTDDRAETSGRADRFLAGLSWDATWRSMEGIVRDAVGGARTRPDLARLASAGVAGTGDLTVAAARAAFGPAAATEATLE